MTKLTKQQQKDNALKAYLAIADTAYNAYQAIARPAWKAYKAIADPAYDAYEAIADPARDANKAKLAKIDAQPGEIITHNGRKYKLIGGSDE